MKHNHTTRRFQRSGQSSYARHSKRPYVYSDFYQRWRQALKDGRVSDMRDAARRHAMQFLGWDATSLTERRQQDQAFSENRRRAA